MDHDSLRRMLSDYLDGAVSPADKALIEEHLQECSACRTALLELEHTRLHLRSLGPMEPPPWLATRIMARVREEAGRETGLFRRLFLPLRWKLPIEAAALVFLTVTGYLVYRSVSPELKSAVPQLHEARETAAPAPPQTGLHRESSKKQAPAKGTSPGPAESVQGFREKGGLDTIATPVAPAENLAMPAPQPAVGSAGAGEEKKAAESETSSDYAVPVPAQRNFAAKPEREMMAPSSALRAKSQAAAVVREKRISIAVADSNSAAGLIAALAKELGGAVVHRDIREDGGIMVVRVDGARLAEFIDRIEHIGDLREKTRAPSGAEGAYNVIIRLERVER